METCKLTRNVCVKKTSDLLRISQAAATAHLDALGLTGAAKKNGLVWVIIRIHGEVYAPVNGEVTVETWPGVSQRGFLPRYCRIYAADGTLAASFVTLWVLADAESRTLAEGASLGVPEMETGYELPIPRALPRKRMEVTGTFRVKPEWIDANGHMNNCCYLDAAEETLHLTAIPKALWVDYRHELLPGSEARISSMQEENVVTISGHGDVEHFRMKLEY